MIENKMNFETLWETISIDLAEIIKAHSGLNYFANNRAKFEGWLKVELCNILSKHTQNITPEKERIDIVVNNWAIELKTINTNYNCNNVKPKTRPITKNINGILEDIKNLKINNKYTNKAVAFIVFPLSENNLLWQKHLAKIRKEISELKHISMSFKNNVPCVFYMCKI